MTELKVGISSFAHPHADAYAEVLLRSPRAQLVGFSDPDDMRAERVVAQYSIPRLSEDDLLAAGLDALIVCSENSRHRDIVLKAAAAGVHVLCEKPLATSLADAGEVTEACRRAGVLLRTAFPMRFAGPIREAKRLADAGTLGPIGAIEGVNQGVIPLGTGGWFLDPALAGGGAVTDHSVHLADCYRWILSDEVHRVYAQTNSLIGTGPGVETAGLLVLEFSRGAVATIDCSWSRPPGYPSWGGLDLKIVARDAVLDLDAFAQHFTEYDQHRSSWTDWGDSSNAAMIDEFLTGCRTGVTPSSDPLDGLRAAAIVEAAYESISTGIPVNVSTIAHPQPATKEWNQI
jgi:predicted dehydrogenase